MDTYLIIGVLLIFIIVGVILFISTNKIKKNGVEAEAEVSRIDVRVTKTIHDETGMVDTATTKTYYVKYKNQDGNEIEAMLQNPSMKMSEGDIIKIKYLPEKPNRVIRIK